MTSKENVNELKWSAGMNLKNLITETPKSKAEAEQTVERIVFAIKNDIDGEENVGMPQSVLNLCFRKYFQLLEQYKIKDIHFNQLPNAELSPADVRSFQMLYAVLLTQQHSDFDLILLKNRCLLTMKESTRIQNASLLPILKTLNLLCKKFPAQCMDMQISLREIYQCMQSSQYGMREETLILFTHCCKQQGQAKVYFQYIVENWPWTNRNKLYLLSCVLSNCKLDECLSVQQRRDEFFAGLGMTLSYKSLLAASQYLVKALSTQNSQGLLTLSTHILLRGSRKELQNFHAQWFSRITQKDELFELLQGQLEIAHYLDQSSTTLDETECFRLILIFSMFARQIFATSKLHFFKISTELITNCFQHPVESQMLIFQFVVDNLSNFAIEDCLEFVLAFVRHHRYIDNAQHRNGILGKLPTVINYIAKTFNKLHTQEVNTTLEASITTFFQQLQLVIETDMRCAQYQPKIFALRLCELLLKSLYARRVQKNAKNCNVSQNQRLGCFLMDERQIFNASHMTAELLNLLNDPLGYDDALELVVQLLDVLSSGSAECVQLCKQFVRRCNIEECMLTALYAKVALQSCDEQQLEITARELYTFANDAVVEALSAFKMDPLLLCKEHHHLIGYLHIMNAVVTYVPNTCVLLFDALLQTVEEILHAVLECLNLANLRATEVAAVAASFQDMDESLELLVCESAYKAEDHVECRKFLLMTFWLTLKCCCDLAYSIGCHLTSNAYTQTENVNLSLLSRCLQVHVAVLTRCRHKGAIEAAGVSVGKLTKCITGQLAGNTKAYELLHECLTLLFDIGKQVSTTRRGAGFSIMLLHIVKNEEACERRLILQRVMQRIWQQLQLKSAPVNTNCDRPEALTLHYLCVLVKDTELRVAMTPYYSDIMMAAIRQIDNPDWTVCNAALQLFGALVPKIVGQRQAIEFEESVEWLPTEVTYDEIAQQLAQPCAYMLSYCGDRTGSGNGSSTRAIILFLSFLAHVEHLSKDANDATDAATATANNNHVDVLVQQFRELMWRLLQHYCEQVRQLAAHCFVRAHELRRDLPRALLTISQMIFAVTNENFFEGLVYTLNAGVAKLRHEGKYMLSKHAVSALMQQLRVNVQMHFKLRAHFKPYTCAKLLDLLLRLDFDVESDEIQKIKAFKGMAHTVGHDVLVQRLAQIFNVNQ